MTAARRIALATPHARYDSLESNLRTHDGFEVLRIRQRADLSVENLAAFAPSHVFLPHWSWKIPEAVLVLHECVIFHMTDLPFGRGGSPLQNLVVRGIEQTKLTALRCSAELDAGPVYLKRDLSTLGSAEEVFQRAAKLMEGMIVSIANGAIEPTDQTGDVVAFARRRPEQGDLGKVSSLAEAHDVIRMLDADGYPHAFLEAGGLRFEFTRASMRLDHVAADVRITRAEPKEPS